VKPYNLVNTIRRERFWCRMRC